MVREVVSAYLDREGFHVTEAKTGTAALEVLRSEEPNLVILDVMLPEIDGLTVLSEVRRHSDIPVILLTARAEESDRILGLELGADDYVVKPFSPRELVARVRAVLKRLQRAETEYERHDFGDLIVDGRTREVFVGGEQVDMTPREFELLEFLCASPRQVFSRVQLLDHVWGSSPDWQDPATVTVHVRRVRQKIEKDLETPRWVTTVWGVGYRFEP
jgi:DNA-binding response OmpR family regulator